MDELSVPRQLNFDLLYLSNSGGIFLSVLPNVIFIHLFVKFKEFIVAFLLSVSSGRVFEQI